MEVVFRKLPPADALEAQPGEIYLVPAAAEQRGRQDLARFVLEHGPNGLLRGPGPPQRLVIDAEPRLDDMLAAEFARRQLQGPPPSAGCEAFARYTALLREGARSGTVPLEDSPEGLFLAIRGYTEKALTDPETGRQFLADWARLAESILEAAEEAEDPLTTPLLGVASAGATGLRSINRHTAAHRTEADFPREQVFLAMDFDVYRQDFARGERWRVRLPGSAAPAQGLLLRQPKSVLFKYWTRSPCPAPQGGPYHFLAVAWGKGKWIFSTSSADKVSLAPLADLLQAAERKHALDRAESDPWSAGSPPHAVLAAPRGGTRLPEPVVLRIVRKWCRARPTDGVGRFRQAALLAGCLAAVVAVGLFLARPWLPGKTDRLLDVHDLYVLSVGVSKYANLEELPSAARDADAVAAAFQKLEGALCNKVVTKVLKDEQATRDEIINFGLKAWLLEQQAPTRHSLVLVTFSGHGFIENGTNRYHFAPHDYDPMKDSTTGIFLTQLQPYLATLPCPAVLVFDTCHSGAVNDNDEDDPNNPQNQQRLQKAVREFSSKNGLVVMAACAPNQKANETSRWGHGAFTLALLEGIEGRYLYKGAGLARSPLPRVGAGGLVSLGELDRYVTDRVEVLSSEITNPKHRRQAVRTYCSGGISPAQIPIAVQQAR